MKGDGNRSRPSEMSHQLSDPVGGEHCGRRSRALRLRGLLALLPLAESAMGLASIAMGSAFVAAAEPGFVLEIKYGRVPDSVRLIRVKQGDLVKLRWTSDQPLVVHLHGYDIEQPVDPGVVTDMTFA